jgi:single-strand DNA-binding protein
MNKVILMGRLTRNPEARYSQAAEPIAVVRFGIAVNRRFKRPNEPDADFFDCVAFGKNGEFVEKYFKKGQMIAVMGTLRNSSWDDQQTGQKRYRTEVIVDETYFPESKASADASRGGGGNFGAPQGDFNANNAPSQPPAQQGGQNQGFFSIDQNIDDEDLPF